MILFGQRLRKVPIAREHLKIAYLGLVLMHITLSNGDHLVANLLTSYEVLPAGSEALTVGSKALQANFKARTPRLIHDEEIMVIVPYRADAPLLKN